MNERKIYILLTDTGTLFTKLIKLYTRKPYNHASISCDQSLVEVYSFGRKSNRNPFIGGFVKEDIKDSLFEHAECAIYSITVTDTQVKEVNDYIQKIKEQQHLYRYNFLGLFAVMFNRPMKRNNAFFCSQFVATVLKECHITNFKNPLSLVTPQNLQEASSFQLVYQGKLNEYDNDITIQRKISMAGSPTGMVPIEL